MPVEVGQIVEGRVTGITKFGVFADIGEGQSGLIHISEVALTYVEDINDFVKINDVVKMKVMNISEDGKISLSIKRAMEQPNNSRGLNKPQNGQNRPRRQYSKEDSSPANAVWTPKKQESASFEEMMAKFKQASDEKMSDLKRKNIETRRPKKGSYNG